MAKSPGELIWVEDFLPLGTERKPMFGGFAYCFDQKLILVIFESPGDRTYKNLSFDFDIWDGCLFPVEKEKHLQVIEKYPFLINHPVLPKWLYLPRQKNHFDEHCEIILQQLRKLDPLFGVVPKQKKSALKKTTQLQPQPRLNLKVPTMFQDEDRHIALKKAKKISDLKNLGAVAEKSFFEVGIKTVEQFEKLGWQKTLEKLAVRNIKNCHTIYTYALIGALKNKEWTQLDDKDKQLAKDFTKTLRHRLMSSTKKSKSVKKNKK